MTWHAASCPTVFSWHPRTDTRCLCGARTPALSARQTLVEACNVEPGDWLAFVRYVAERYRIAERFR